MTVSPVLIKELKKAILRLIQLLADEGYALSAKVHLGEKQNSLLITLCIDRKVTSVAQYQWEMLYKGLFDVFQTETDSVEIGLSATHFYFPLTYEQLFRLFTFFTRFVGKRCSSASTKYASRYLTANSKAFSFAS